MCLDSSCIQEMLSNRLSRNAIVLEKIWVTLCDEIQELGMNPSMKVNDVALPFSVVFAMYVFVGWGNTRN